MSQLSQLSQLPKSPSEFPLEALPQPVLLFVREAAAAIGVDSALIAGPCLAALAGCIGNRRRIVVKPGSWTEIACLWIMIVQRSGGKKTPAVSAVLEHLHECEAAELEKAKKRMAEYEKLRKKGDKTGEPKPAQRFLVSDATTEAVLSIHTEAPLGLLLHRDELAGWLKSFNQYKGGRGSDAQCWTKMHQGRPALVDRKGGEPLSVPRACVSICGGIQPEILAMTLTGEHFYDGIAARLLFVAPPENVKSWSEATISEQAKRGWSDLLDQLRDLRPDGEGNPIDLAMADEAKALWIEYYDQHAEREAGADGPFRSALSKLEAMTARFALVIQLTEDSRSTEVTLEAMQAGIAISEWFETQATFVFLSSKLKALEKDRKEACEWIAKNGGSTLAREFARLGPNKFRKRSKEVLDGLVEAGVVEAQKSGPGAERYYLIDFDNRDSAIQTQ